MFPFYLVAEEKPVDIWNIDKQEAESISEENLSIEKKEEISQSSIYKMQSDKNEDSIKLDQDLTSKTIKIAPNIDEQNDPKINRKSCTILNDLLVDSNKILEAKSDPSWIKDL